MRTRGWSGSPDSSHFAKVPVLGGMEALQVLLRTASPTQTKQRTRRNVSEMAETSAGDNNSLKVLVLRTGGWQIAFPSEHPFFDIRNTKTNSIFIF